MQLLRLALESANVADGKMVKEIEHVFYAQLADFEQLGGAASWEKQEQWEIKIEKTPENGSKGKIRVRAVKRGNDDWEYILTSKVSTPKGDHFEVEVPTTADMMATFKFLGSSGMRKDRYQFPIVGSELIWEVDMFLKEDGSYFEWCKIDLEVPSKDSMVPPFPLKVVRLITDDYGKRNPEDEALISGLYKNEFILKNKYA